ncbi:MAG: IS200/IS605 family transposase [Planctomycetaceae bacterium]|nr:IS200/IS605 family transposase [Planctomycetaceae bacterium]
MSTYTCLKYHLIFGTQYRRPLLLKPIRQELYAYIGGIIRDEGGNLDSIGGIEDHVHILCGIPPRIAVSNMLRAIKASSSKWINDNRRTTSEFRWQRGFAAFSVSKSKMPDVDCYIGNQEVHHLKISFEDEYRNFLIRHGIKFEEQYLFEDEHTG